MLSLRHRSAAQAQIELEQSALLLNRLLSRVYDPEIGLVRSLIEVPVQPDEANIHIAVAEFQNPFRIAPLANCFQGALPRDDEFMGTGAGVDRLSALWSTVGEAIERFSLHQYDPEQVQVARASELEGRVVEPSQFILFSPDQYERPGFPYKPYDATKPLGWTRAKHLISGNTAALPARLALYGYQAQVEYDSLDAGYSTGAAAGPDWQSVWTSGLFEVIERDGFACHWYLRQSPPELPLQDHIEFMDPQLVRVIQSSPLRLRFFDLTTDLQIPVVLAIGLPMGGGIAIGASSRATYAEAISKAAIEAFHTHNWTLDLRRHGATVSGADALTGYRDHVVFHLEPANRQMASFLWEGAQPRFKSAVPATRSQSALLSWMLEHLEARGFEVFGVDHTVTELSGLGIEVGRVVVPGLQPLAAGAGLQHFDPRRLSQFAQAIGIDLPPRLNLDPHPFP